MKKQLLLCLSFLMITAFASLSAATGTITVVSIQSPIQVGGTGTITLTYTSDVECKLNAQLRQTTPGTLSPDFGPWHGQMFSGVLPIASVATTVTLNYAVSGSEVTSANLPATVQYTFFFQLNPTVGSGGYAGNSGTAANLVTINPSSTVTNNVNITSAPTTVAAGSSLNIGYNYTSAAANQVKVEVAKFNSLGNYMTNVAFVIINPAGPTTTTPVADTKALLIPNGTIPSASLTGGETYKVLVAVNDPTGAYITGKTSDIIITPSLGVQENTKNQLSFYPNPAKDVLNISSNGSEFKSFSIIDMLGRTVQTINNAENVQSVDVSNLKAGVYLINTDTKQSYKFIKQ